MYPFKLGKYDIGFNGQKCWYVIPRQYGPYATFEEAEAAAEEANRKLKASRVLQVSHQ